MKALVVAGLLVAGLTISAGLAKADLAPPVPEPKSVPVKFYYDEKAKESRVQIPMGYTLTRVRPVPRPGLVAPPIEPAPGKQSPQNSPTPRGNPAKPDGEIQEDLSFNDWQAEGTFSPDSDSKNSNHLMIAGMALTMGLGCGGVWLLRRPNSSSLAGIAALLASGAVLGGSTLIWANAPPPRKPLEPKIDLPMLAEGSIKFEMVARGETINIILDKATREKLLKKD